MALIVVRAGLFDVIQDRGRPGHRSIGVPPSGPFDPISATIANALLDNDPGAATLEMTLLGGDYLAEAPLALALAGAPMAASIRSASGEIRPLSIPQSAGLEAGDRLVLGRALRGARTYLAARGGWLGPVVLGSRSNEEPLVSSSRLDAAESTTRTHRVAIPTFPGDDPSPIRVVDGPETPEADDWLGNAYRVSSRGDRMGLRLEGPPIAVETDPSRFSTPVAFGTIQVAGGQPIVLGPASGTMGGYPIAALVISADLPRLGQLRPGSPVRFARVPIEEARELDRRSRDELRSLDLRIRTRVRGGSPRRTESPT